MPSGSQQKPWSDNPNALKIPYQLYFWEKSLFAGNLISSILYGMPGYGYLQPHDRLSALTLFVRLILGIVVVVSFKCIAALFNPIYRRGERVKWGLVCYTVVMFSLATIETAMTLDVQSISYIDNREFLAKGALPGPIGYQGILYPEAINIVPNVAYALSNWLADGLLVSSLFDVAFPHPCV